MEKGKGRSENCDGSIISLYDEMKERSWRKKQDEGRERLKAKG
jgi:hypothetical protein